MPVLTERERCKQHLPVVSELGGNWARPTGHGPARAVSYGEALGTQEVRLSKLALLCACAKEMNQSFPQNFINGMAHCFI